MAKLTQCKQDHHHKMGTKIKGDKETATNEDRVNLAKVCILEGSSIGSEMFHISNTAVTLAGRGSDVADSKISHIRSHKQVDDLLEYPILIQDTIRFKTSTTSDHRIFPHRDSFYLPYAITLAWHTCLLLVVVKGTTIICSQVSVTRCIMQINRLTRKLQPFSTSASIIFGS